MPAPASSSEHFMDAWIDAREAVHADPALAFTLRRLCLLPASRRAGAAAQAARRMKAAGESPAVIRLTEALADPRVASAVLAALPAPVGARPRRRWMWLFVAASLLLHPLMIVLMVLLWVWYATLQPAPEPPRGGQIRVTLTPQAQPPPLAPPLEVPKNIPFLDTAGLPTLDQPDPRAAFEGERNTAAMSRMAGPGNPALPNQTGDQRPGIELFNSDYSPEVPNRPAPPVPETKAEQKPEPPAEAAEPAASKPNAPLQEKLRTAPGARLQTGEKSEAEKIREAEQTTPGRRPTQPAESRAPPAAFSAFKRENRIEGGAAAGEVNSAAARETDMGRYKAKLYRAIGSRWYAYVRQDDGKIGIGVVRLRFYVRHDGVILPPEIIQGAEHAALLAVSRRSVMEVSGQLEPFPPSMRQQLGDGYYEEVSFSIY